MNGNEINETTIRTFRKMNESFYFLERVKVVVLEKKEMRIIFRTLEPRGVFVYVFMERVFEL